MKNINTVIFDLDNTLYDFKYFWEKAHHELYKKLNIQEVDYNKFMNEYLIQDNLLWDEIIAKKINLNELRILRPYNTFKKLGIHKSKDFCEEFYFKMFNVLIDKVSIDEKINKILSNLKGNYKLYILTNGFKTEQEMKLNKLGINKYFENIFISECIGYSKPDLNAFLYLVDKSHIIPNNAVVIGDSYINDIEPAIKLGFNTLHIDFNKLVSLSYDFDKDILEQLNGDIVWSKKR